MVESRWIDNVCYYEYTPTTIAYLEDMDGFTVARADIPSRDRRHRVVLVIVVTDRELVADRTLLQGAIRRGRAILEWLVEAHRALADEISQDTSFCFDIRGQRLRGVGPPDDVPASPLTRKSSASRPPILKTLIVGLVLRFLVLIVEHATQNSNAGADRGAHAGIAGDRAERRASG